MGSEGADGFAILTRLASEIEESAIPTVGVIRWALPEVQVSEAFIEFGLDTGYGTVAPVDLSCPEFRTVLVGLKAERTYHYRIVATAGDATHTSDDRTITTGPAPQDFHEWALQIERPDEVDRGFFVTSTWSIGGGSYEVWKAAIVDSDGDLVWWHQAEPGPTTNESGFGRARISADNRDVWLAPLTNRGGPLLRVSIDTLETQTYDETIASHDIAAVGGETMAYIDYSDGDCTGFSEIRKDGTTIPIVDLQSTLGLAGCHANSLHYSRSEDVYVLSLRSRDVYVFDRDGQVLWTLAERVSGGNEAWGGVQHGTHLLDDGILILANYTERERAEALEYGLDGNLRASFFPPSGDYGSASFLGSVQRLPSGSTVVAVGGSAALFSPAGELAFEMGGFPAWGYTEFRTSLYAPPDDIRE